MLTSHTFGLIFLPRAQGVRWNFLPSSSPLLTPFLFIIITVIVIRWEERGGQCPCFVADHDARLQNGEGQGSRCHEVLLTPDTFTNDHKPLHAPFYEAFAGQTSFKKSYYDFLWLKYCRSDFLFHFFFKFNYFLFVSLFISFSWTFVRIYFQARPLLPITHITMYTHSDSHPFHRLDTFLWYILSCILSPYTVL